MDLDAIGSPGGIGLWGLANTHENALHPTHGTHPQEILAMLDQVSWGRWVASKDWQGGDNVAQLAAAREWCQRLILIDQHAQNLSRGE